MGKCGNTQIHLFHMIHMVHDTYDTHDTYSQDSWSHFWDKCGKHTEVGHIFGTNSCDVGMYVYMCVCMYVCIYVCMYVCVYTFLGQVLIHMIHLLHTHEKVDHIFGTNLGKYTNALLT